MLGGEQVSVRLEERPAVWYTICREDVGRWVFENLVRGNRGSVCGAEVYCYLSMAVVCGGRRLIGVKESMKEGGEL